MPTYKYRCNGCGKSYSEHRSVDEKQTFTTCECGTEYTEITE